MNAAGDKFAGPAVVDYIERGGVVPYLITLCIQKHAAYYHGRGQDSVRNLHCLTPLSVIESGPPRKSADGSRVIACGSLER